MAYGTCLLSKNTGNGIEGSNPSLSAIIPPTHCPACGSEVSETDSGMLYCTNPDCEAKASKKVMHFAKTAKIKGLGPATIEKLELNAVEDIYLYGKEQLIDELGEKIGSKLFAEIENSKNLPLENLLPAFGVPLIGETASKKLCKVASHIEELNKEKCTLAGLGPAATLNLLNWLKEDYQIKYKSLPFSFRFSNTIEPVATKATVCITGKLTSFKTKAEAETALKSAGYVVKGTLTKDVTILINESGIESTKTEKARQAGVIIVTDIKQILGEN